MYAWVCVCVFTHYKKDTICFEVPCSCPLSCSYSVPSLYSVSVSFAVHILPLLFPRLLSWFPPSHISVFSHSCACHRNLNIGSCMQAEYNTTTSHLHHQHDNVKLEIHSLTWSMTSRCCGGSCAGIRHKISHVMLHCSIYSYFKRERLWRESGGERSELSLNELHRSLVLLLFRICL